MASHARPRTPLDVDRLLVQNEDKLRALQVSLLVSMTCSGCLSVQFLVDIMS